MNAPNLAWRWERCLKALGIASLPELLLYLPQRYLDYRRPVTRLRDMLLGEQVYLALRVVEAPVAVDGRTPRVEMVVEDDCHEQARVVSFGAGRRYDWVTPGKRLHLYGRLERWRGELRISAPEPVRRELRGRVVPVYRRCPGVVSADSLRECIQQHFTLWAEAVTQLVEERTGLDDAALMAEAATGFTGVRELLAALHCPKSPQEAAAGMEAARRLAALCVVRQAQQRLRAAGGARVPVTPEGALRWAARVPFELTPGQRQAIAEIAGDLAAARPMRRLLSGDYGTGKTVAYVVAAVATQATGGRVAILMPNTLLAEQVQAEMGQWFPEIPRALVTGNVRRLPDLDDNPVLIGTTALLHRLAGRDYTPELLVIDEQQKLSRDQREQLLLPRTNLLEVTATCIPRTQALVRYGAMAVSTLRECPVAKTIYSHIVGNAGKQAMFEHVRGLVAAGGQVAIVYPEVAASPEATRMTVEAAAARWEKRFPGQVGVLHGKMSETQKLDIVQRMKRGEFAVLVCSTVIEVGVTIPALRALVVVQAERYGVTTLHQLRGRVARLGGEGWFYMYLPLAVTPAALARLQLLEQHDDGFALAEQDMWQRGFGDLEDQAHRQTGQSVSLFNNLKLMPRDIERALARVARARDAGEPGAPCRAQQAGTPLRQASFAFAEASPAAAAS